jgi:hypothetical protein
MSNWIKVEDQLPEASVLVLVYFPFRCIRVAFFSNNIGWCHELDDTEAEPTHWQPLPDPPS